MGANIRDNKDLLAVIKQLVNQLSPEGREQYERKCERRVIDEINDAVKMLEKHPRFLDEFLYSTEKQIFSHADKTSMRAFGVWRHATTEEYGDDKKIKMAEQKECDDSDS